MAEIHGKRCLAVDGNEDWLTSAIFGQLRLVSVQPFWIEFLKHAKSASGIGLDRRVAEHNINTGGYKDLEIKFWPSFSGDEPDLLVRFFGSDAPDFVLIIEVKLRASKSGIGKKDQLVRYLRHLEQMPSHFLNSKSVQAFRPLIYLTEKYAMEEVEESVAYSVESDLASERLFGMQWQDLLEAAREALRSESSNLLAEVIDFLHIKGFDRFQGFAFESWSPVSGSFYNPSYFDWSQIWQQVETLSTGGFYE